MNVDTVSLANQPQGDFFGYIQTGMILKGGTSGAEAKITNLRFVADFSSTVQGSFFIPNPNVNTNPTFSTGQRTFELVDSSTNDPDEITTTAGDNYDASGLLIQFKKMLFQLETQEFKLSKHPKTGLYLNKQEPQLKLMWLVLIQLIEL